MADHAYSFYCNDKVFQHCDEKDLESVVTLCEKHYEDGTLSEKEVIYRCRVCGGFYKYKYRAVYHPAGQFNAEEGWDFSSRYFKIEEPLWGSFGSTLDVPFTIQEARKYGYAGEDHTWKNGRCNFPPQNVELTCRGGDLKFVADATSNDWDHLRNKFYRCQRCGEWYLFTPLPPHPQGLFKSSNEIFPVAAARAHGFDDGSKTNDESSKVPTDAGAVVTLQVIVQEALVLAPGVLRDATYKINFFCRVPRDWIENNRLKTEFWNRIGSQIFGEDWTAEILPGARYVIKSCETVFLRDDFVKERNWREVVETDDNLYYFFLGGTDGSADKVTAQEFQENVNAYFQPSDDNAPPEAVDLYEPENLFELSDSLSDAWHEPEKLPEMHDWLQYRRSEASCAQYAYLILKKHFAREKLSLRKEKLPASWWSMGWALYLNIDALVRERKHSAMLTAMFAELIDFCHAADSEYFALRLKELLGKFIESPDSRVKMMSLLPDKAVAQFAEIDQMINDEYQDYLDRANQSGY